MRTLIIYTAVAGAIYFVPGNSEGHALPSFDEPVEYDVACLDTLPEKHKFAEPEGEVAIRYC